MSHWTVPPGAAALAVILPCIAHVLVGNFLEPHLFGSQFRMSPVIILFSIGVWWILWGIVGAMLAVPLTSVLRIITSDLLQNGAGGPYLYVLNSLLEGRPLDVALPGSDLDGFRGDVMRKSSCASDAFEPSNFQYPQHAD